MKNIKIYLLALLTAFFGWSCDPLEEDLEEIRESQSISKVLDYTLTDDDYDYLDEEFGVAGYGNFNNEDEAKEYIPYVLDNEFPALGAGSSITANYNIYRGNFVYVDELELEDFAAVNDEITEPFFNDTYESDDYLAEIAANLNSSAVNGQIQVIEYFYANADYTDVEGFKLFHENFNELDSLPYETFSLEGEQEWQTYSSSSGYQAAQMSGYAGSNQPNMDWMVLPEIDLTNNDQAVLKMSQVLNFLGTGVIGVDIAVMASIDYDGDPATASWTSLVLDEWPTGDNWDIYESQASLAAFAGQTINIGFFYKSTTDYAPNWRIIEVDIKTTDAERRYAYYQYSATNDEWDEADDVVVLDEADYDAMGLPGYFRSSTPADDYLPQLLMQQFPFIQEEESKVVIYNYYSSSAGEVQTRGDFYSYLDGMWVKYESEIEASLQFGNENGVWVPDNTIRYTINADDFSMIAANESLGNAGARENLSTFGNFNVNAGYWSDADILDAINFILKERFPGSEVGQKYLVSYDTYPRGLLEMHVILTSSGDYELVP